MSEHDETATHPVPGFDPEPTATLEAAHDAGIDSGTETDTGTGTEPATPAPRRRAGRHPLRSGHLVAGLAYLGFVLVWALVSSTALDAGDLRWLLPVPFLVAGAVGLASAAVGSGRRGAAAQGWQ